MNPPKLAAVALTVMAEATVKADDDTINAIQATRGFLRAIVSGLLVVAPAAPPVPAAPPPEK